MSNWSTVRDSSCSANGSSHLRDEGVIPRLQAEVQRIISGISAPDAVEKLERLLVEVNQFIDKKGNAPSILELKYVVLKTLALVHSTSPVVDLYVAYHYGLKALEILFGIDCGEKPGSELSSSLPLAAGEGPLMIFRTAKLAYRCGDCLSCLNLLKATNSLFVKNPLIRSQNELINACEDAIGAQTPFHHAAVSSPSTSLCAISVSAELECPKGHEIADKDAETALESLLRELEAIINKKDLVSVALMSPMITTLATVVSCENTMSVCEADSCSSSDVTESVQSHSNSAAMVNSSSNSAPTPRASSSSASSTTTKRVTRSAAVDAEANGDGMDELVVCINYSCRYYLSMVIDLRVTGCGPVI